MTEKDKQNFVALLSVVAEIYHGKKFSGELYQAYWNCLSNYKFEAVKDAINYYLKDKERSKFIPKPGDVIEIIENVQNEWVDERIKKFVALVHRATEDENEKYQKSLVGKFDMSTVDGLDEFRKASSKTVLPVFNEIDFNDIIILKLISIYGSVSALIKSKREDLKKIYFAYLVAEDPAKFLNEQENKFPSLNSLVSGEVSKLKLAIAK